METCRTATADGHARRELDVRDPVRVRSEQGPDGDARREPDVWEPRGGAARAPEPGKATPPHQHGRPCEQRLGAAVARGPECVHADHRAKPDPRGLAGP